MSSQEPSQDEPSQDSSVGGLLGGRISNYAARVRKSTEEMWTNVREKFDEFFDGMKTTPNGFHPLATPPESVDAMLVTATTVPHYDILCRFLHHAATRASGKLGAAPTVRYVCQLFAFLRSYIKHHARLRIPKQVAMAVLVYIAEDLQVELGLQRLSRVKRIVDMKAIRSLIYAVFEPKAKTRSVRARWQISLWISYTTQTLLRIGACVRTSKAFTDQRPLTWGDVALKVTPKAPINDISAVFVPPNGKTPASKFIEVELERERDSYRDPVLHLLVLAHYAGALPTTHTLTELLDPSIAAAGGSSSFSVKFNPAKATEAVFRGLTHGEDSDWTATDIREQIAGLSELLDVDYRISPHMIRRSGAVALKRAGVSPDLIKKQLTHAAGSYAYKTYVGDINTARTVEAVYGSAPLDDDGVDLHPTMVFDLETYHALRPVDRDKICGDETLIDLAVECEETASELMIMHGVTSTSAIPSDARASAEEAYQRVVHRYNELYSTVSKRDPSTAWDRFPCAATCQHLAIQAINFLSEFRFDDAGHAIELMLDEETIDADQYLDMLEAVDVQRSAATHDALGAAATSSTTAAVTPTQAPAPITAVPAPVSSIINENSTVFTTLASLRLRLFPAQSPSADAPLARLDDLVDVLTQIPNNDNLLYGFRPGHAPVDGLCNFCSHPITNVVAFPARATAQQIRMIIETHVNGCASKKPKLDFMATFPDTYKATYERNPINGQTPRSAAAPNHPDDWEKSVFVLSAKIQNAVRAIAKGKPAPRCHLCPARPILPNVDAWRGHMLAVHDTLVPTIQVGVAERVEALKRPWTAEAARIFSVYPPVYWLSESRYVIDPHEQHNVAVDILDARIVQASAGVTGYGLRTDVSIPAEHAHLVADESGTFPPDGKYASLHLRSGRTRDFLCVICSNDPALSAVTRALPHNLSISSHHAHQTECLRGLVDKLCELEKLKESGDLYTRDHYMWRADGTFRCSDRVCSSRVFSNKYLLANHLFLVHFFKFKGQLMEGNTKPPVNQFLFSSEDELETWAKEKTARRKSRNSRSQTAESSVPATAPAESTAPTESTPAAGPSRSRERKAVSYKEHDDEGEDTPVPKRRQRDDDDWEETPVRKGRRTA